MASFGQKLRQAREARNITLQEIADTTKIGTRALQALEWERFDQLPGGIFNKGFVRSYARCVGLDEEETVAAYMEAAKVPPPETDMQTLAVQVEAARAARRGPWSPNAASVVGVVAVIVALILGAVWMRERRKESRELIEAQQRESSAAASAQVAQAPAVQSVPENVAQNAVDPNANQSAAPNTAQSAPQSSTPNTNQNAVSAATTSPGQIAGVKGVAAGAVTESPAPVEVSISANARAWISVLRDDKPAETLTLDPKNPELSTRSYKAKDKLKLILGNPAGVSVTYNGKPAGTLGKEGQRAVVTFTAEGIEKQ